MIFASLSNWNEHNSECLWKPVLILHDFLKEGHSANLFTCPALLNELGINFCYLQTILWRLFVRLCMYVWPLSYFYFWLCKFAYFLTGTNYTPTNFPRSFRSIFSFKDWKTLQRRDNILRITNRNVHFQFFLHYFLITVLLFYPNIEWLNYWGTGKCHFLKGW